jgi:putative N6-adenine-specific DNA methylase
MNSSFFLVILPGLEEIALNELRNKLILLQEDNYSANIVKGGIELEIFEDLGFYLNKILKIPTRILLRIKAFRCRDLPKLHKVVLGISWNQYLHQLPAEIEVSSHQSRLFNSKKIIECLNQTFDTYFKAYPLSKKYFEKIEKEKIQHQVHIRFIDDLCTISIDTSGDLLYYREKKTFRGNAPLRETIAAALFLRLKNEIPLVNLPLTLIDPMCGSGNLLSESKNYLSPNLSRNFNYSYFPKCIKNIPKEYNFNQNDSQITSFIGLDQDLELVTKIKEVKEDIIFYHEDLFSDQKNSTSNNVVVLTNPPYNKKIKTKHADQAYYESIINRIVIKYNPNFLGIIIPSGFNLDNISDLNLVDKIKFRNGGIPVTYYLYKLESLQ